MGLRNKKNTVGENTLKFALFLIFYHRTSTDGYRWTEASEHGGFLSWPVWLFLCL